MVSFKTHFLQHTIFKQEGFACAFQTMTNSIKKLIIGYLKENHSSMFNLFLAEVQSNLQQHYILPMKTA